MHGWFRKLSIASAAIPFRMKSDTDDPNNHVPKVSPGDDWYDLDTDSEKSKMGLPPRRMDRGLPPKKETKGAVFSRHDPKLVELCPVEEPEDSTDEDDSGGEAQSKSKRGGVAKKAAKKTTKKAARKSAKKSAKKKGAESPPPSLNEVEEESVLPKEEDDIRLPPAPSGKPNRVSHSIGGGDAVDSDPRPATRPIQKISSNLKNDRSGGSDEDVARMRRRFVRGERQDWGEEKGRGSSNWMIYTGVGIILLVILTVALNQTGGKKKTRESDKSLYSQLEVTEEKSVEETDDLELLEIFTNSKQEAKEMYGIFATAATPADLSEFLFNKDQVLPIIEKRWKPLGVKEGWVPGDQAVWAVHDRNGQRYGVLKGSHPDFTGFYAYFRKEGDGLKLDWKATVGYGTSIFDELKTGVGDGAEIRTLISLTDFYTFALPEENFRSFRLMSPDGNTNLWAYTERDSELDQTLMKLYIPSQITGEALTKVQVVLRMEPGPENGLKNQWLIRDFTRLSWLDELPK